jgi:hypothetical protein
MCSKFDCEASGCFASEVWQQVCQGGPLSVSVIIITITISERTFDILLCTKTQYVLQKHRECVCVGDDGGCVRVGCEMCMDRGAGE